MSSELAKAAIWSDDQALDFHTNAIPSVAAPESSDGGPQADSLPPTPEPPPVGQTGFEYDEGLFQALAEDPFFLVGVEERLAAKVEARLSLEGEAKHRQGFERGLVEGRAEGLRAFEDESRAVLTKLSNAVDAWFEARERLLDEMARPWADALAELIRRFLLLPNAPKAEAIVAWVTQELSQLPHAEKITISLSPVDFKELANRISELSQSRWRLQPQAELTPGDVAVQIDGTGNLFSNEEALQRLERILFQSR